jgi:hypothetical protein
LRNKILLAACNTVLQSFISTRFDLSVMSSVISVFLTVPSKEEFTTFESSIPASNLSWLNKCLDGLKKKGWSKQQELDCIAAVVIKHKQLNLPIICREIRDMVRVYAVDIIGIKNKKHEKLFITNVVRGLHYVVDDVEVYDSKVETCVVGCCCAICCSPCLLIAGAFKCLEGCFWFTKDSCRVGCASIDRRIHPQV